jgi:glycine/D-amino acid oxidase-like deaminating enzyme
MRPRAPLPNEADVVVVGGGVIGVSAVFHLAEAGAAVVLIERDELGSGSSSKAAGGIRAQFSDELNIAISTRSMEAYEDFEGRPGWEIDFKRNGYLFVLDDEQQVSAFERSIALQNAHGVPSRLLTPHEALEVCPLLNLEGVLAAAYSADDAHATPDSVVQGYAFGARALGAHLQTRCAVEQISVRDNAIREVITSDGTVRTDTVVCAAGAWSGPCGAMVGVDLPVRPLRRQVLFTEPIDGLPNPLPLTIDFSTGMYFHREGPGLLLSMPDPEDVFGYSVETSDDWVEALIAVGERRVPMIADVGIKGGWAGLYDMSPDHNAIIGEAPAVSRFLYATGFSGHGFMQAPAVGEIMRDLVLRRPSFVDVSAMSVDRFDGSASLAGEFNFV